MPDRVKCCIAECRRTFRCTDEDANKETMCGRCWRTADAPLIRRYRALRRRWRRVERLLRRKAIQVNPRAIARERGLHQAFWRAFEANWLALKSDVQIKSAMRMDGTAGALADRRTRR